MATDGYVPVACPICRKMWVKNMSKKIHPCHICGAKLLFYDNPAKYLPPDELNKLDTTTWDVAYPSSKSSQTLGNIKSFRMKYRCPSCGKIEMEFEMHGLWD
ncbi:MAG: hypothetical protein PHR77_04655 [Kiritimatiellae bacterium]|nr:hypothetical protein [Kiritimatiellia bacterium]